MNAERAKNLAMWIFRSVAVVAALTVGLAFQIKGAERLGVFMVWVFAVLSCGSITDDVRKSWAANDQYPVVDWRVCAVRDITVLGLLAWQGFWFTAVAATWTWLCNVGNYSVIEKMREGADKGSARPCTR